MREDFLHFIWRLARFDLRQLITTTGEAISIQHFGQLNSNAGPDFSGAQLRIDGIHWAGNVEMHVRSGVWYDHGHQHDPAYDNVILHVVLEEDRPVFRSNGERIPCLELRGRIPSGLVNSYWRLTHNEYWIPCQTQLPTVPYLTRKAWLDRLLNERLERNSADMESHLQELKRDWEACFYQSLARSLGGKVNADAMEMLARSVPLRIILRHKHSLLQVEALLFGQSGLIPPESAEAYPKLLLREYKLLAAKYQLRPLPVAIWRYLRLRPANFPTIRIAQLARLLTTTGQLFGKTLAAANAKEMENMYAVELSNYWREHYRFDKASKRSSRRLGKTSVHSILINSVAPLLYLYGKLRDNPLAQQQATDLLEALPPEQNQVLNKWKKLGIPAGSAAESQALLELKKRYCTPRRCLECAIGCSVLNQDSSNPPLLSLNEEALLYVQVGTVSY